MAGNTIKLRLKDGQKEIEIEGAKDEIDQILERWWSAQQPSPEEQTEGRGGGASSSKPASPKARRPQRSGGAASTESKKAEAPADPELEPNRIANSVKESEHFQLIERKIIHPRGDYAKKAAFVLWFVNKPLTSGQISRALEALHIKVRLSNLSTSLRENSAQFIQSGKRQRGAAITYHLTARARSDFEKWLLADGE